MLVATPFGYKILEMTLMSLNREIIKYTMAHPYHRKQ